MSESEAANQSQGPSQPQRTPSTGDHINPNTTIVDPELQRLADDMFTKVSAFMQGNLEGTLDEYKLLQAMNSHTTQRYADMKQITAQVADRLNSLNHKYVQLKPYLDQIDEIDVSSRRLEEAAYALDNYVKNLESRFKQIEKR